MAQLSIWSSGGFRCYGEYTYTQNINTNKTTLVANVKLYCPGGGAGYEAYRGRIQIGGDFYSANKSINLANAGTTTLVSKTYELEHNPDGTVPTGIGMQFSEQDPPGEGSWSYSSHKYLVNIIPTIPRASTITTTPTSLEFNNQAVFNITRASTTFTHDITYNANGTTGTIATNVATSQSWTIPNNLISSYANVTSGQCPINITCTTKNGTTIVGTSTCVVTAIIPNSVVPTVSLVLQDVGTVPSSWGIWLKIKSKIKGTVTGQGVYGSTISSYSSSANNENFNTNVFTTQNINASGDLVVTSTVKDSRNRQAVATQIINVVDYFVPTISSFAVKRCNADGTLNESGTCAKAIITYSIAPINNATTNLNTKTLTVTQGSIVKAIELSDYNGTVESEVFENILVSDYYEFTANLSDYFQTKELSVNVSPIKKALSLHHSRNGVTLGQIATEEGFHSYMPSQFHDTVKLASGNKVLDYEVVDEW